MILQPMTKENTRWDGWQAFHEAIGYLQFVRFDTGELIYLQGRPRPDARRSFDMNVAILATKDHNCPTLYKPDGEKIRSSYLNLTGQQYLLVDYDTKRAVCLHMSYKIPHADRWRENIPVRFRGRAQAYFAGPGEPPQGYAIKVSTPYPYTKEERRHIQGLLTSCKVWQSLREPGKGLPDRLPWAEVKRRAELGIATNTDRAVTINERMLGIAFKDLDLWERWAIALCGFVSKYVATFHPYLEFKP